MDYMDLDVCRLRKAVKLNHSFSQLASQGGGSVVTHMDSSELGPHGFW